MIDGRMILENTLGAIADAKAHGDLHTVVYGIRERHGLANVGYHGVRIRGLPARSAIMIATCNPEWIRRYVEREYWEIDPVLKAARQTHLPVDWTTVDRRSSDARRYFHELADFEIGRWGCTIPLLTPAGDVGVFTFTSNIPDQQQWLEQQRACRTELFTVAHYIHDQAVRLAKTGPHAAGKLKLTRQVRRCLEHLSQGDKPIAIAARMGLSVHTVRKHLVRGMELLECQTPIEAAVKARELGMISGRHQESEDI